MGICPTANTTELNVNEDDDKIRELKFKLAEIEKNERTLIERCYRSNKFITLESHKGTDTTVSHQF